jgi:hypothetical protein
MMKALRSGGGGITENEARYLVDLYYKIQKTRIGVNNQVKGLERDAKKSGNDPEPHEWLDWVLGQFEQMENEVKKILGYYTMTHDMAWFFDQTHGIGPVLSAALLAHIDIRKAPTVGHIYRFAGIEPTQVWCSREDAKRIWNEADGADFEEKLVNVSAVIGRNPERLIHMARFKPDGEEQPLTNEACIKAISRKPFNGQLKTALYKLGDSFMKFSNNENSFYGKIYRRRKQYEWARNLKGDMAGQAADYLSKKNYGKSTEAYSWLSGKCSPKKAQQLLNKGEPPTVALCKDDNGVPMLPPGQIDARARRYAVKIFLSHLQECWWRQEMKEEPPKPFAISMLNHAHYIAPPQDPSKEES